MDSNSIEMVRVKVLPDGRMSRRDAAKYLGRAPKTLAEWKTKGLGPMPLPVGGRIFYRLADLEAFRDTGAREAI